MKKNILLFLFLLPLLILGQEVRLLKGKVTDDIFVNDSIAESYALYLPSNFNMSETWPIIFVFDMDGKGKQALSMFKDAADQEGYVLASSNSVSDTLTLSQNILVTSRMFNAVVKMLPLKKNRTYTGGFSDGARFASILPTFIKDIKGVISCGASLVNLEVLDPKRPFYFVGIVGREDYNYRTMLRDQKVLDKLKFPNQLLVFDGGHDWPAKDKIASAMRIFSISAISVGIESKNDSLITASYGDFLNEGNMLFTQNKPILAEYQITTTQRVFSSLIDLDSLKFTRKVLKRSNSYRASIREQNNYFLKEGFTKEDYNYYLNEDIDTYNYNNLGWWNYQMTELKKVEKSINPFQRRMGKRLRGYINALIADNIDMINSESVVDIEALNLLYMIKTITEPTNYDSYLKIISNSSKMEDYGTALFYLEELLKNGFKDRARLYDLEDTALFRITPEFNELVAKYLKDSRYHLIQN